LKGKAFSLTVIEESWIDDVLKYFEKIINDEKSLTMMVVITIGIILCCAAACKMYCCKKKGDPNLVEEDNQNVPDIERDRRNSIR
jgi:hypothetical protein